MSVIIKQVDEEEIYLFYNAECRVKVVGNMSPTYHSFVTQVVVTKCKEAIF